MNRLNYRKYEYVINENFDLVYIIASRLAIDENSQESLIMAGFDGLLTASRNYDILVNGSFSKYVVTHILKSMKSKYQELELTDN